MSYSGVETIRSSSSRQILQETNENLLRALRINEATNESGYATIQQLSRQKETISNSIEQVEDTRDELRGAQRIIRDIRMQVYKEWAIKALVLILLFLVDVFLFYKKYLQK
uniref:Uncharacterized protein n=1 Tax=Trypanosoma congolense (strain IL3000) TaxID=1068625 RepID=G0UR54_TRYCI|nr:conserved hypothetical protein [Trypanosoma congolense IL3000]